MPKGLYTLIVLLLLQTSIFCQVYNNNSNFVVKPNENVYVQGDFTNQSTGKLVLQGTIHLQGNWTNNAATAGIINNSTNGLVRMIGSTQQTIGGQTGTIFNNLEIANAAHVSLAKDATINEVLTFTAGKIITSANYVIVPNTATSAMVGYNSSRYIVGNLRRYFTGTTNAYDLPLGTMANYELATIKFNAYTGMTYLNTTFIQSTIAQPLHYPNPSAIYVYPDALNPVANPLSIFMSKYSYIWEFLDYGYWTITPDAGSSSSYKLTATSKGHSNGGSTPGQHALIKRSAAGAWRAEGFYPFNSQLGTGNSDVTVYMDQMSTFSDFIIGKAFDGWGPLGIVLLDFNAVCNENKVRLTWTTSNEENNDHFVLERSLNLVSWMEVAQIKGSENSHGNINYEAFDESPFPGVSYYRLKQVDIDGTVTVYEDQWIQYVNCGTDGNFAVQIYPDGNHNIIATFMSQNEGDPFKIEISDLLGRIVALNTGITELGNNTVKITVPASSSIYMVSYKSQGMIKTRKVFISKDQQ